MNVNISAPAFFISLNAESNPIPSLSYIPHTFWQYTRTYGVLLPIAISSQICPKGRFACVIFILFVVVDVVVVVVGGVRAGVVVVVVVAVVVVVVGVGP